MTYKDLSLSESALLGGILGLLGPGTVTDLRWWVWILVLMIPVQQAYAHLRDWVKSRRQP